MAKTKESVTANNTVSDQQSLVKLLMPAVNKAPVKHVIPGGKHLFTDENEMSLPQLERAIYTWLRKVRSFDECTLTFSSKPERYTSKTTRVIDFPTGVVAIWNLPSKGKMYLAHVMAEQVSKGSLVSISAKKDGLYINKETSGKLVPGGDDWEPYLEFVRSKRDEY